MEWLGRLTGTSSARPNWPPSAYVGSEIVGVQTLDTLAKQLGLAQQRIYLKRHPRTPHRRRKQGHDPVP